MSQFESADVLRASLASQLSAMYAEEVPKYGHLVDATSRVNAKHGDVRDAGRLGAERHGAVRVASFAELGQLASLFGLYGMEAVGYYDLRAGSTPIPVVSTAFRPVEPRSLEANPFRMFTSTLVASDERFFDIDMQSELKRRLDERQLLSRELADLVGASVTNGGVSLGQAARFVELTVDVFRLNDDPIDAAWHGALDAVSPVASDIAAAAGTHLNHLTPRVVDIDELHGLLEAEGVTMIDRIQGPPSWDGPDVLLRQTSFRALDETRSFRDSSGRSVDKTVRVRFGEVEQRGIALTRQGRGKVDGAMDAGKTSSSEAERVAAIRDALNAALSPSIEELAIEGDAFFLASPGSSSVIGQCSLAQLIEHGCIVVEPITYEDFLPASAAGIFASNLAHDGAHVDDTGARLDDADRMRAAVGIVHDPYALYAAQQNESLTRTLQTLGLPPEEIS